MSPKDEKWTPKLVRPPKKNPEGRTYFDWNDEKLKRWKDDAIKMQEAHVSDNNRTEWFVYTPEERDAIELRILMALYGVRIPQDDTRGVPSCPLKTYTRDQKRDARKIKKMIVKKSSSSEKIYFNVIYISNATKSDDTDEVLDSEEPVFVVGKCRKFVDKDAKAYDNFNDYKKNNNLPKGAMMFPQNGSYIPEDNDDRVSLELDETPATSPIKRIRAVTDKIVMVGGIVLAVTGVVTCCAPALFSAMATTAIQTGSFILTGYSIVGAAHGIYDKTSRDESIRTEVLLLAASAFSAGVGRLNMYWKTQMSRYAREGKTFTELADKITQIQKNIFAGVNLITFVSSASSLLSSIVDLWNKKERTWLDYYQFCMSLFMTMNVLTKPKTIQDVFESEQVQYLYEIKQSLGSEESKQEMSSTVEEHSTSDQKAHLIKKLNTKENRTEFFELQCLDKIKDNLDSEEAKQAMLSMVEQHSAPGQKACLIRNLKKIENPTEFFELINKTGSVVTCTPDGLIVNGKILISPERYNEIGKAVFNDKFAQITRYPETAVHKSLLNGFGKLIPSDKKKEFEQRLDEIKNLPADQRKEAMRSLVTELNNGVSATAEAFNNSWNTAEKACNKDVDDQIKKLINNLKQGSNETEQKEDFDKLKDLATKQINGTITSKQKEELQQQIDKCSRHRKQYFFQSSANHRNDANYDERMNNLEKELAGGKNLEEWKMAQHDLENALQNQIISDAEYQQQKAEIVNGIKQSKHVRDFRSKADVFVDPTSDSTNGSRLKETFIRECQTALEEARQSGNADAIANAQEKLRIAQEINTKLDANVLETTQSFKRDIWTFTNSQNERLCYYVDIDQVKSELQHIYEHPNVEDITVNGDKIYANMKIGEYDRLHRALKEYRPNGKEFMTAATKIASHPDFAKHVTTPHDIVSIAEAIDTYMGDADESRRQECLNNLASNTSDDYSNFCKAFSKKIKAVENLSPSIRSQWSSLLSMAYHGWKHEGDIANEKVTIAEYFTEYANKLFNPKNMTVQAHTQSGDFAETYMLSFGKRIHVGFTVGSNRTRTSFFGKKDTR